MATRSEINDMVYAFRYYTNRGQTEALRVFPEYEQFFSANQHRSAEEVEARLWNQQEQPVKVQRPRSRRRIALPAYRFTEAIVWVKTWNLFNKLKAHRTVKAVPADTVEV